MQFHFKIKGANSFSNGLSTVPYALRAIFIATLALRNLPSASGYNPAQADFSTSAFIPKFQTTISENPAVTKNCPAMYKIILKIRSFELAFIKNPFTISAWAAIKIVHPAKSSAE